MRRSKIAGLVLLAGAMVAVPVLLGCGGGGEEAPRPTAGAAPTHSSGTYWGGGGGGSGSAPSIGGGGGSAGMRVGGGGGGAIGDAMRRRRREREEDMRRRLGPVRLTDDGSELWPLYEDAVRRMEREIAGEDDECAQAMTAGEIFAEDVGGEAMAIGERARNARCRAYDETAARCASSDYVENHHEECDPLIRRGERFRREVSDEHPDPDVIERAMASGRESARRAGLTHSSDGEEPEVPVLPDMNIPARGDGVASD